MSKKKTSCSCPQLPGTILRISIPAGAVVNLLNIVELSSPGGICIILRLPFVSGLRFPDFDLGSLRVPDFDLRRLFRAPNFNLGCFLRAVRAAGGTIECLKCR